MRLTLLCSILLSVVASHSVLGDTIECKRVEAHFDGTFTNKHNSHVFIAAKFRMVIDTLGKNDRVQMIIDQWNSSTNPSDNKLWLYQSKNYVYPACDITKVCDQSFPTSDNEIFFSMGNNATDYPLFWQQNHKSDKFQLFETIGQCTNKLRFDGSKFQNKIVDPSNYRACWCCDGYSPDPSLNCPIAPATSGAMPTLSFGTILAILALVYFI